MKISLALIAGLVAVVSSRSASGQAVLSAARGITLIAIKPPSVQPLDAVRLHDLAWNATDVNGMASFDAIVDVRDDGACNIEVEQTDKATHADLAVRDVDGRGRSLASHLPVRIFQGRCRAVAPQHAIQVVASRALLGASAADSVELFVRVVIGRGDLVRTWSARLMVPARRTAIEE